MKVGHVIFSRNPARRLYTDLYNVYNLAWFLYELR